MLPTSDQRYAQLVHIATAGTVTVVEVPFVPDAWVIVPETSLPQAVYYSPDTSIDARMAGMPIRGSAPSTIAGQRGSNRLYLYNSGSVDKTFRVAASVGSIPAVLSAPVSIAAPDTIDPDLVNLYTAVAPSTSHTFKITHHGGPLLSFVLYNRGGSGQGYVSSVTVGGVGLTYLNSGVYYNGTNLTYTSYAYIGMLNMPAGENISVVVPCTNGTMCVYMLSFPFGVKLGNTARLDSSAPTITNTIIGAEAWANYVAMAASASTAVEGSGAANVLPQTRITSSWSAYAWRHVGNGPQDSVMTYSGAGNYSGVAVEIAA